MPSNHWVFGALGVRNKDAIHGESLSKLGRSPDPNMGLHVLMSRPEIPLGFQSLFGFEFSTSPTHSCGQVVFPNIPFLKNWDIK